MLAGEMTGATLHRVDDNSPDPYQAAGIGALIGVQLRLAY